MRHLRRLDVGRLAVLALLLAGVAAFVTRDQWDWLLEDGSVQSDGVTAPEIDDVDDAAERLYRIGDGSSATYIVNERLAGTSRSTSGTSPAVAGDIAINVVDPTASRIGTVVVNVEMFESDSNLRDRRIRHDFLESTRFPFAEFATTRISGLPAAVTDGEPTGITVSGDLTVKETTAPTTFTGTATVTPDELRATMSATVLMSTFDVGPINIAGLVHTDDEVTLTLELIAPRVALDSSPTPAPGFVAADPAPPAGAFAAEVMPILERSCAGCHTEGGPGWSTVALDTAAHAAEIADDLALVTGARYMPPWPANDAGLTFAHDWSLSDDDIATIAEWAADGGGLDVDPDTSLVPDPAKVRAIDADEVVAGEAYVGSLDRTDDYRCQVYDVGDPDTERWVTGLAFEPDRTDVVHHALIFRAAADQRANAERVSGSDGNPGWTCYGPSGVASSQVAGWAPGTPPTELPDGTGIRLAPGDFFVVQIHYHYDHDTPADRSALAVDLASPDDLAAAGGQLDALAYATYLAPAELPCTPDETGPLCDRSTVIAQLFDEYGAFSGVIPDGLVRQCGLDLDEVMADTDGVTTAHCDRPIVNPGRIVNLWPHMHEFGASIRMVLNPDTPQEQVLVEVPVWSFDWQLDYQPVDDVIIDGDDVLRLECTWDRSLAEQPEPRYITWNVGTGDEMCYSTIATMPVRGVADAG